MRIDRPDDGDSPPDIGDAPVAHGADAARREPDTEPNAGDRTARVLEYRATVDAVYRAHAIDQGCARVREIEEKTVTPAMRRIEAEDPGRHLAGLEHRLKGKDRLTEKINAVVEERGHPVEQAFTMVKDAIRYTFCYAEDRYTEGVYADCERIENAGFERVDRRNSWDAEEYKGINSRWRVPGSEQFFEVQFHTRASLDGKEETHAAYERLRTLPEDDAEVGELHRYQREVTAKVPVPAGATDIPHYRYS